MNAYKWKMLMISLALLFALTPVIPVTGHPGEVLTSAWSVNPVTIDAAETTLVEWADANICEITYCDIDTGEEMMTAMLWLKNDADYLYMKWENDPDALVVQVFFFDQNNNGLIEPGEDGKVAIEDLDFVDFFWDGSDWEDDVIRFDGVQAATEIDGHIFREVKIPLKSGDPWDMAVVAGDTLGFMIDAPEPDCVWPLWADPYDAETWGDLVLATPPPVIEEKLDELEEKTDQLKGDILERIGGLESTILSMLHDITAKLDTILEKLKPAVGGVIVPVSKLELIAPWIGWAVVLSIAVAAALVIRRRKP